MLNRVLSAGTVQETYPFICISLSEEASVYYSDVVVLYNNFGHKNKPMKLFLEFHIEMNKKLFDPFLPLFICDVTKDPKTELNKLATELWFEHIEDLLEMFTPSQKFVNKIEEFLQKYLEDRAEYECVYERLKQLSVPSLCELSRDTLKKAMCTKLNIKKQNLPVPSVVEEILAYQVSINFFFDLQIKLNYFCQLFNHSHLKCRL